MMYNTRCKKWMMLGSVFLVVKRLVINFMAHLVKYIPITKSSGIKNNSPNVIGCSEKVITSNDKNPLIFSNIIIKFTFYFAPKKTFDGSMRNLVPIASRPNNIK